MIASRQKPVSFPYLANGTLFKLSGGEAYWGPESQKTFLKINSDQVMDVGTGHITPMWLSSPVIMAGCVLPHQELIKSKTRANRCERALLSALVNRLWAAVEADRFAYAAKKQLPWWCRWTFSATLQRLMAEGFIREAPAGPPPSPYGMRSCYDAGYKLTAQGVLRAIAQGVLVL